MSKKGLKNPAGLIVASEGAKKASKAAKSVDKNTNNALSWLAVIAVGAGLFYVVRALGLIGKTTDAAGNIIDSIGGAFEPTTGSGGGNVGTIDPNYKPPGATINATQAQTIASQLLDNMDGVGKAKEENKQNIYTLLFNKTAVDYQMISNAFGTPRRNPFTGEEALPGFGERLNLTQWLTIELGSGGINFLKTITHGIF